MTPRQVLLIITTALVAGIEPALAWDYAREGAGGFSVLIHASGDVISAGSQGDFLTGVHRGVVIRHDAENGSEKWRHPLEADATGAVVLLTPSGDHVLAVTSDGSDSEAVRLQAETGEADWRTNFQEVSLVAAAVDNAGDLIGAGSTLGTPPGSVYPDLIVVKLSGTTGMELWRTVIDGPIHGSDRAEAVVVDQQGAVLVGGSLSDDPLLGFPDFGIVSLSGTDGTELWRTKVSSLGAHGGSVRALALDQTGALVAAGATVLIGWCDFVVAKLNVADGAEVWRYAEDWGCDHAWDVAVDPGGDVIATGSLSGLSTVKLSGSTGSRLWRHDVVIGTTPVNGPYPIIGHWEGPTAGRHVRALPNGNALISGSGAGLTSGLNELIVAELDTNTGQEVWIHRSHHVDSCGDADWGGSGLAVSQTGRIVVSDKYRAQVDGSCLPYRMHYFTKEIVPDSDSDNVDDDDDNCLLDANAAQLDSDADGFGNACDPDYDNSGMVSIGDAQHFRAVFGLNQSDPGFDPEVDADASGAITLSDLMSLRSHFGKAPGPSALDCAGTVPCAAPTP